MECPLYSHHKTHKHGKKGSGLIIVTRVRKHSNKFIAQLGYPQK